MRIIKLIIGIACIVVGLYFTFGVISCLLSDGVPEAAFCTIPATLFTMIGLLLVAKRKGPMSMKSKAAMAVFMFLLGYFIFVILIPGFVAVKYVSNRNDCVNNLRQLQAAKNEWALENGIANGTLVAANDITPYIQLDSRGQLPKCPAGGTYILGRVGEDVKCSIGTSDWPYRHTLSDTNDFSWWTNLKEAYATLLGLHHPQNPDR